MIIFCIAFRGLLFYLISLDFCFYFGGGDEIRNFRAMPLFRSLTMKIKTKLSNSSLSSSSPPSSPSLQMQSSFEVVRSRTYGYGRESAAEDTNISPTGKRFDSLIGDGVGRQASSGMAVLEKEGVVDCGMKLKERRRSRFKEEFGHEI